MDRIPLNGTFELTARCNLSCKMCLVRVDDKRIKELGGREKTAEEWINMARQVRDAGTVGLLLTGGEPMLRTDFCEIYGEIAKMGFMITLYTNATMVNDKIMNMLEKYPPHKIGVTIYGSSNEVYKKVCGYSKAYDNALNGIRRLIKLPSKITLRTTIIKDNRDDLVNIERLAKSLGDLPFNVSRLVSYPVRGGVADVESCRLSPIENVDMLYGRAKNLIEKEYSYKSTPKTIKVDNVKNIDRQEYLESIKPYMYGCSAGIDSYTITWDGKLIGCQLLGDCYEYPFESSFINSWENYPKKIVMPQYDEKCTKCRFSSNCVACPATRFLETGKLNGIPKYICEEAEYLSILSEEIKNKYL